MIATAGRMPTTTVWASSTAATDAIVESIRPMKRVDDLQRGDVDHHAARAGLDDPLGQVLLQRERDLVLQVDLDRDQQDVADAEDRDAVHHVSAHLATRVASATILEPRARSA